MFDARKLTVALLVFGIAALVLGTALHPAHEDPNDAARAFAEYAADKTWLASHFLQFAGAAAMLTGMLAALAQNAARKGSASSLMPLTAFAAAAIALSAALQAVDGVALKMMVGRWAAAEGAEKALLFSASLAVRSVEIGLAAMTSLVTGLAVISLSFWLWRLKAGGFLLALLGLAGGLGLCASAIAIGAGGFSGLAMMINMPSSLALMLWVAAHAYIRWRGGGTG
jgi:hypothetical protein